MSSRELTYGDIIRIFKEQFPGMDMDDVRPNGPNEIFVWIKNSKHNLIATYLPNTDTFMVKTTTDMWGASPRKESPIMSEASLTEKALIIMEKRFIDAAKMSNSNEIYGALAIIAAIMHDTRDELFGSEPKKYDLSEWI